MLYFSVLVFLLVNTYFCSRAKNKKSASKWFFVSGLLVLGIMSGCRFQVGGRSDMYRNYVHVYEAEFISWGEILTPSLEFLHRVLRKIVITIFGDPQAYFFITAFFISGVFFTSLKKYSPNFMLGVIMFYTGSYFSANNITGQYIAIAISLFGIKYIIENKPWNFFFCVLLALGFHASAVIVIPLYFLSKSKFTKNHLILYTIIGLLVVLFNRQVTNIIRLFMYENYGDGEGYGESSSNPIRLIWPAFSFLCMMISKAEGYQYIPESLRGDTVKITRFNNLIFHGTVLSIYFSLLSATSMLVFSRVAAYFSIYSTLNEIYGIKASSNRNTRRILTLALWGLVIVWFLYKNWQGKLNPTPYTPFWEYPWRAIP